MEANGVVLHAGSFHFHPARHQLAVPKIRRDPVEHMMPSVADVIGNLIFKGKHAVYVEVAGAGDKIMLIGILAGKLKADQVAAVVEVLAVHAVIFRLNPSGGMDGADAAALLCGH